MNKVSFSKLDLDLYSETLDNGLRIFVVPMSKIDNIYVNFSTDYGSNQIEFEDANTKKMRRVPYGIAHFLEHKMFEQENGIDPFTYFSESGSDANACTNNVKTSYLFMGPNFLEDNLNCLLDYVQSPYFTDKNVEKEKGIIEQEIKMYQDDPYSILFEGVIFNTFVNHPFKYSIIGNVDSINKITKEDLYACYNTFYHPSNMFVTITGNVDPENVISIIKSNQAKKEFSKINSIKLKDYHEPDTVAVKDEIKKMDVTVPKVAISYKFNIENSNLELRDIYAYMNILFETKIGNSSLLAENLKNNEIITGPLSYTIVDIGSHVVVTIAGESEKPEELIKQIKSTISDYKITKEDLLRRKKMMISTLIYISDNLYSVNSKLMNNLVRYKKIYTDDFDNIKNLNIKEYNNLFKKLNFTNISTYIVKKV